MGIHQLVSEEELKSLFDDSLVDSVRNPKLRGHLSGILFRFVKSQAQNPFFNPQSAYERIINLQGAPVRREAYKELTELGDSYLMFAGFYPEYLLYMQRYKRNPMSFGDFVSIGKHAYGNAYGLSRGIHDLTPPVEVIHELERGFERAADVLFGARRRLDFNWESHLMEYFDFISSRLEADDSRMILQRSEPFVTPSHRIH